jgi:hypothetical protein
MARYGAVVDLFAPDTAWAEAREHLPIILKKRGVPVEPALSLLNSLEGVIQPVLATALPSGSPIWTEDNDFFGIGVATWTADRVELFLGAAGPSDQFGQCQSAMPGHMPTRFGGIWQSAFARCEPRV